MKQIIFLIIPFLYFANANNIKNVNIAFLGVDNKTASNKTITKVITKIFNRIESLENTRINTKFYSEDNELLKDFKSKQNKFDILYMTPFKYIDNYKFFNSFGVNFTNLKISNKDYVQYYIVVKNDSNIKDLKNIKNKRVVFQTSDHLAMMWFDYLSLQENKKSYKELILKQNNSTSLYKKILDVYFNKIDMAIVPRSIWETTILLNPTISENLKIIKKSPEIFPSVIGIFHRSVKEEIKEAYNKYLFSKESKAYSEKFLQLVKLKTADKIDNEYFKEAYFFYKDYLLLKESLK